MRNVSGRSKGRQFARLTSKSHNPALNVNIGATDILKGQAGCERITIMG